jgi:hypothetical protein
MEIGGKQANGMLNGEECKSATPTSRLVFAPIIIKRGGRIYLEVLVAMKSALAWTKTAYS